MRLTLGVDVGGVIADRIAETTETCLLGARPLGTPVVTGAPESLRQLAADPFEGRVYIVSKAGATVAANTRAWLEHLRFFDRTGIPRRNLHFVEERPDKAAVCHRLRVTHFIDDELEVLGCMTSVRERYLFIGGLGMNDPPSSVPSWVNIAKSWRELVGAIRVDDSD